MLMKIKTFCHVVCLVSCPLLLLAQVERDVMVSFPYKGTTQAHFLYKIVESDITPLGSDNHSYEFIKDREITIRVKQLEWRGNTITREDGLSLEFKAPQATTRQTIILEERIEDLAFQFYLNGIQKEISISVSVKDSNNNGLILNKKDLILTFKKKKEPKQEEVKEEKDPVPPPTVIVETAEDKAWKAAGTLEDYEAFLVRYPASAKYGKDLMLKLNQMRNLRYDKINETDSIFTYRVYNISRKPAVTFGTGLALKNDGKWENYKYTFDLVLQNTDSVWVQICDAENPSKKKADKKCIRFEVGNPLFAEMKPGEDSLRFTIKGGKPPYSVFFRANDDRDQEVFKLRGPDSLHQLAVADLKSRLDPGTYLIEVNDQNNDYYEIPSPLSPYVIVWEIPLSWYIAAGVVLVLIVVFFLYRRLSARKKERRREAMLRQIQENKSEMAAAESVPLEPTLISIQASTSDAADPDRSGNFSIRPRANEFGSDKALSPEAFQRMVQPSTYLPLHLDRLWANSALKTIYFNRESILELDQFLRVENTSKIKENDKDIPEIGGMLLGKFTKDNLDNYEVTVEKFAPIASKSSNVYRLEFSVESFALDLTAIQDEFPELLLVGWFHTHPGHGLFLSPPDLKIHNHFREHYQFAMEIDSVTQDLDTGFFTRQQDGKINNQENLLPGARWFAWTEIEKFTRKSR